ncbi:23698_t:CDS:2, partial [Gigaspora rosea]
MQESEYNAILEQVMAKRQKKQKLNDVGDNKENMFHNSYNILDNSSFLEYSNNDNSLSWDEKKAIEQKTTQEPIAGETQGTDSLHGGTNSDTSPDLNSAKGNGEHETIDQTATALDIAADSVRTNMNNTEEQIQTIMELLDEERKQVIMGFSPDTNSTEVEMIDSTVNELIPSEIHMTDVLDTKDNTLVQQGNSEAPNTPTYTRGNENLRDELDTLSSSSKTADRSSAHSESHSMETATKATQPEDTNWLYSEGFKPVINK